MRECIYCGRQLEKGEVCNCAMSVAKRREREANGQNNRSEPENGYTINNDKADKKEEKRRAREEKKQAKQQARQQSKHKNKDKSKRAFSGALHLLAEFMKSPIETIMNPMGMGKAEMFILVIAEGIIGGLCAYSIVTGASRGPFSFLGNILGFKGASGYSVLLGWLMSAVSGAVSGCILFFIYSGIFYLINKWVFRQFSPYWEFVKRFAFVPIPVSIVGIAGIVLGMFSQHTFAMLLVAGTVGSVILTYELLRSIWYSSSASKTMFTMMIAIFVFMVIAANIVRLSM